MSFKFAKLADGSFVPFVAQVGNTTPLLISFFARTTNTTIMTGVAVIGDLTISVADATGVVTGSYIVIFNKTTKRFYQGRSLNAPVGNIISLDTPLDSDFEVGNTVAIARTNINENGSSNSIIYQLRGDQADPIDISVHINKIVLTMELSSDATYEKFGNIETLAKGVVFRLVNGITQNIFNIKDNREIANLTSDFKFIVAQGTAKDGISAIFTFSGFTEMGAAIQVKPGGNLQIIIQDDLTALTKFEIMAHGHISE